MTRGADCHFFKQGTRYSPIRERTPRETVADAVAEVIERIPPVGVDAAFPLSALQRSRDVTFRRATSRARRTKFARGAAFSRAPTGDASVRGLLMGKFRPLANIRAKAAGRCTGEANLTVKRKNPNARGAQLPAWWSSPQACGERCPDERRSCAA